jgi:hypothetical protein
MSALEKETIVDTTRTVPLKAPKPGDPGRHSVPGLRGYRVLRLGKREQFAFSTLSGFVLSVVGEAHVSQSGLRLCGTGPATATP